MILADKITENRKKNGWSQEELADKLGVSRQSVSKWESAQAVPDMKKILQLSEIFGVSTDYLMKDEIEAAESNPAPVENGLEETVRRVSMEEASEFLTGNEAAAEKISLAVMICILSPVAMIFLGGLAESGHLPITEVTAAICGLIILLIMVACAVGIFISESMKGKRFEYLGTTDIDTEYGVDGMVRERSSAYSEKHSRLLIIGIMLCMIAVVPLLMLQLAHYSNNSDVLPVVGVCALIITVAAGVRLIVLTCIRQGGYDKLLETGDYSRLNKKAGKYDGIYWAVATAIYLGWSFMNMRWDITWVVWPIAGVLFVAYREVMKAIVRSKQ